MDNNITIKSLLTDIGDAIREKNGETEKIIANEMPNKIRALSTSGGSNEIWYPEVNDNGDISWEKSNTNISPVPQNIKGPQGQGINWRGLYSSVETYNILDAVFYNNNSYICTVNNNTKNPSASITDTSEFNALISKEDTNINFTLKEGNIYSVKINNGISVEYTAQNDGNYIWIGSVSPNEYTTYGWFCYTNAEEGNHFICGNNVLNSTFSIKEQSSIESNGWALLAAQGQKGDPGVDGTQIIISPANVIPEVVNGAILILYEPD